MSRESFWRELMVAYLHDPPDKALDIKGHEGRSRKYLGAALGEEVSRGDVHSTATTGDIQASIAERPPLPSPGAEYERAVSPDNGTLKVYHPLSGTEITIEPVALDDSAVRDAISDLVEKLSTDEQRFLTVWRSLKDTMPEYQHLPAETRMPDHSIWNHLDTTAGLKAAMSGQEGAAFLSFKMGPVQPFIEAARSLRDLKTGSYILSWLTFSAMIPVLEKYGPTSVVFPALRGVPLVDRWLKKKGLDVPQSADIRNASLPNHFLAVVPLNDGGLSAQQLGDECCKAAQEAWSVIAGAVRGALNKQIKEPGWDALWDQQIQSFFDFRSSVLPWTHASEETIEKQLARLVYHSDELAKGNRNLGKVRGLADAIPEADRPSYHKSARGSIGLWQTRVKLSSMLMDALKTVRHYPVYNPGNYAAPKCCLLGSYEQMGPATLSESNKFWEKHGSVKINGVHLRKNERLSAVSLTKRFAWPGYFRNELGVELTESRLPDTATVAAAKWLKRAKLGHEKVDGWSGQWLHWPKRDFDKDEQTVPEDVWKSIEGARRASHSSPPAYFAVLVMDGDHMGKWLAGENAPEMGRLYHPTIRGYFEGLNNERAREGLKAKRLVSPAMHAAISEALNNFAIHIAPAIVKGFDGTLIYSGGDDVLALLPTETALACAHRLQAAFRGLKAVNNGEEEGFYKTDDGRTLLTMGPKATISAGIAVVHYKEDLRFALNEARSAEKAAKAAERDILSLRVCRRSGEHVGALLPWALAGDEMFSGWVDAFVNDASDRWAYHLRTELETLRALPVEAMRSELVRNLKRAEEKTRKLKTVAQSFDYYRAAILPKHLPDKEKENPDAFVFEQFVTLVQSASFMARGRDA